MVQQVGDRPAALKAAVVAFLAIVVAAIAIAPQAWAQAAPPDRRAVSDGEEDNGLPIWYQDADRTRVFQCLGDQALCAIEDPNAVDEVVYWSGEASMPVGGQEGEARLVMAVEGAFDPDAGGTPITGSVISVDADGLRPNTAYTVSHPYGGFRVRTDADGAFPRNANTLAEAGCDIEAGQQCNFALALRSPVFRNLLRWDATRPAPPQGYLGDPERLHTVVGSPVRDAANRPQNYFRIEGPRAGGPGDERAQVNRFSIVGQLNRDTDTALAPPETDQ